MHNALGNTRGTGRKHNEQRMVEGKLLEFQGWVGALLRLARPQEIVQETSVN